MSSPSRRRRLISLTPLIDVVFILLVFFMLAATLVDRRQIELATTSETAATAAGDAAILVRLRPGGPSLEGEALTLDRLVERLADQTGDRILLEPLAGVTLETVVAVLDRLAAAGLTDLALVPERAE